MNRALGLRIVDLQRDDLPLGKPLPPLIVDDLRLQTPYRDLPNPRGVQLHTASEPVGIEQLE
jgi:hypothetical protein